MHTGVLTLPKLLVDWAPSPFAASHYHFHRPTSPTALSTLSWPHCAVSPLSTPALPLSPSLSFAWLLPALLRRFKALIGKYLILSYGYGFSALYLSFTPLLLFPRTLSPIADQAKIHYTHIRLINRRPLESWPRECEESGRAERCSETHSSAVAWLLESQSVTVSHTERKMQYYIHIYLSVQIRYTEKMV